MQLQSLYISNTPQNILSLVNWECKIHQLPLCIEVRPCPNEYPGYDTKESDDEALVMLELWGMQSAPSLPLLPGQLWLRVVELKRVLSRGQIELFWHLNWVQTNDLFWFDLFEIELFDDLTACKQMTAV